MKLILITSAIAVAFLSAAQANESDSTIVSGTDTVKVITKPDSVTICDTDGHFAINVYGGNNNPNYRYTYERTAADSCAETIAESEWSFRVPFVDNAKRETRRSMFTFECGGLGIGFDDARDAPQNLNVNMANSAELFFDHVAGVRYRPWRDNFSILVGIGFGWRNYRMTGLNRFVKDGANLKIEDYPEGAEPKFSRIKLFNFCVPIMLNEDFGKHFSIGAGAVVNLNTHASMKTRYYQEGLLITDKTDNIHPNKITVDFMGVITFRNVGVYAKYSPMKVLDTTFGPSFKHCSVGAIFCY
ncbi:MAG: hypothetical protein PUE90_07455 [Bacteroidales bacterium]|nr:hypothetical protein [Bacteroidales bacterium]